MILCSSLMTDHVDRVPVMWNSLGPFLRFSLVKRMVENEILFGGVLGSVGK